MKEDTQTMKFTILGEKRGGKLIVSIQGSKSCFLRTAEELYKDKNLLEGFATSEICHIAWLAESAMHKQQNLCSSQGCH